MERRSLSILLALGFFAVLGVSLWQLFVSNTGQEKGLEAGQPMPEFAAPLAGSGLDADSNVVQRGDADEDRAACSVDLPGAFNSCGHDRLAVMFWLNKNECIRAVDLLSDAAAKYPNVKIAAVAVGQSIEAAAKISRGRGWQIDIPVDRDRAAALTYRVIGCPTLVMSHRGQITSVELGRMTAQEIDAKLIELSKRNGDGAPTRATAGASGAAGG